MKRIPLCLLAALPCLAAETVVTQGDGRFADEPSMARASDGSLYLAWNGFREGSDALMIARYRFANGEFHKLGSWEALGGRGVSLLRPRVVAAGAEVFVLYAAERNRQWDVFALPCGARGPGREIAVSRDAAADVNPDGAWREGALWVAWESNRGSARRILLAAVRGGAVPVVEEVSAAGRSHYEPSVAVEPNGTVDVAWHSFRDHNYDVYLRCRAASGEWSAERRISRAPTVDRHAVLALDRGHLWIFWENASFEGYRTGNSLRRKIVGARLAPHGLESPRDFGEPARRGEGAAPAFDSTGRLWLAYLLPTAERNQGWTAWLTGFNGASWTAPAQVSPPRKGMDRQPALALDGGRAFLAFQFDNNFGRPATIEASARIESGIVLASVELQAAPAAGSLALAPLAESAEPFDAGRLRVQYGEDAPPVSIESGGRRLRLLFGDLHTHSEISVCARCTNQSVDENYQVRRDLHNLDFACMTDHGYNQTAYLWNYTAKKARANEDPGRLTTFLAQEWTSEFKRDRKEEYPYGYYGHRNLILADPYFPRWWNAHAGGTPAELWAELEKMKANYVNIPHQIADTGNVPTAWNFADEKSQPVAEIFQARGSYEHHMAPRQAMRSIPTPGWFLHDAWARGVVVGVIASPDHAGGLGKACVWAPDASRAAILDAIRARHTYGTTAARIALEVRVNGALMGDRISAVRGKPVEVKVRADCPSAIDRVEVCRNNRFIYTQRPEGRNASFTFVDTAPQPDTSYYYVRVMQKDEEIAWSSPVWVTAKP